MELLKYVIKVIVITVIKGRALELDPGLRSLRIKALSGVQKTAGLPEGLHSVSRIYGFFSSLVVVIMLSCCFFPSPFFAVLLAGASLLGGTVACQMKCPKSINSRGQRHCWKRQREGPVLLSWFLTDLIEFEMNLLVWWMGEIETFLPGPASPLCLGSWMATLSHRGQLPSTLI